jgi:hypothetical protein
MHQSETVIKLLIHNQQKGTPYCDYFTIEEEILFIADNPESKRVLFRHSGYINFSKKTVFE